MKRLLTTLVALAVLAAIPAVSLADATHVVRKGDTLGKIARAHHVSVAKIQEANALEGTRLSVGTKLVLPGGKAHPKRRKAHAHAGVDSKGTTLHTGTWKPPTEAELADLARRRKRRTPFTRPSPHPPTSPRPRTPRKRTSRSRTVSCVSPFIGGDQKL